MSTSLTKNITFRTNLEKVNAEVRELQNRLKSLDPSSANFKDVVKELVKAEKQQDKLNAQLAKQKKIEDSILKVKEAQRKAIEAQGKLQALPQQQETQHIRDAWSQGVLGVKNMKQFKAFNLFKNGLFANKQIEISDAIAVNAAAQESKQAEIAQLEAEREGLTGGKKGAKTRQINKKKGELAALQKESEGLKDSQVKTTGKAVAAAATIKMVGNAMRTLVKPINDFASGVVDATKAILNMKTGAASFSSSSLITNASARETKLKYGMNDSQAYGFTQAKSLLNIQSDEDLMYMNSEQRERLLGYMERYSAWYDEMESSGVLASVQEMQLEFEQFKQEIAMEFLQWVAENKDVIMACIKGIFNFIKGIAQLIMNIISIISFGQSNGNSAFGSDTWNSNSVNTDNSRINNVNINANVTNNGSNAAMTSQDKMWSDLAKQIVSATE